MSFIYTWVSAYQQIASRFSAYQANHIGLIEVLEAIGVEGFDDRGNDNIVIKLDDIDPFTFISYLNKYGDDKRIKILNNLCQLWNINVKVYDVCGIPSSNAQKVWLFPYKFERTNNEIERLWGLYNSVLNDTVTNEQLIDVQTIRSVGWTKITEGLFVLKPEKYLPLNSVVNPYLTSLGIHVNNQSYDGIVQTCDFVKKFTEKPFYQISYEGWLHGEELKRQPKYWRLGTKAGDDGGYVLPEMLENNVASIGWDNLGDLKKITPLNKTEVQKKLATENYNGNNNTASRKAGEIMNFLNSVWLNDYIIAMDGAQVKAIGKVLHNQYIHLSDLDFPNCRVVDWLKRDITGIAFEEGLRTTLTEITNKENINKLKNYMNSEGAPLLIDLNNPQPLNQILYGPPGTGKTYNSIDIAVKIITGTSSTHKINKPVFDKLKQDGQIEFVTFHQNYSYEDFMVGLRPDPEDAILRFKPHKGIFYKIAQRAKENYYASKEERSLVKDFETILTELFEPLESGGEVEVKMASGISYLITDITSSTIRFRKSNNSTNHTLSIDTLKEIVQGTRTLNSGLVVYYNPLVKLIKEKQQGGDSTPKEALKRYVLIIDEINRANISRVFGELITLLEDDKRLGGDNELTITLPNDEKNFGVPPNLFVVGTMNTADKSIALLDIALRRRFEFIGKYPDYNLLFPDRAELLKKINEAIYRKKKHC